MASSNVPYPFSAENLVLSPAEQVASHEFLLTEILFRLPAKSLLNFKSVAKRWNALISSPEFCHRHVLLHPPKSASGVFLHDMYKPSLCEFLSLSNDHLPYLPAGETLDFPGQRRSIPIPSSRDIKFLLSCNGLMLCCSICRRKDLCEYYIYNPSTNRSKMLVPSPPTGLETYVLGMCLVFDPCKSSHYKVFCVGRWFGQNWISFYSSEDDSWNEWAGNMFDAPSNMDFSNGVYCNDAIHWISLTKKSMYFHVEKEELCKMPSPQVPSTREKALKHFTECNGVLYYFHGCGFQSTTYRVYLMKKSYKCWLLKYKVDLDSLMGHCPLVSECLKGCLILGIARVGRDGKRVLLAHVPCTILAYELETGNSEEICDWYEVSDNDGLAYGWFGAYTYYQSLALV